MKLVVDTSILIDKLRGGRKWDDFLENLDEGVKLYLPSIVVFELFSGISSRKSEMAKKILGFRKYFFGVDLTWEIARKAAEINRDYPGDLDVPDYIIGATALNLGAEVVTLNKKHFSKIPGISIYQTS